MSNEELASLIRGGRIDLAEELWNGIRRFVELKAIDYGQPDFTDDMLQEAFISMVEAAGKYQDDGRSTFLHYYAAYFMPKAFKIAIYGSRSKDVEKRPTVSHTSLDSPVKDGEDTSLSEMLVDPDAEEPYRDIEEADYWRSIGEVLQRGINSINNADIRNVMDFHYHHNATLKDGSRLANVPYSRYTSRYQNGLRSLRRYVKSLPEEEKQKSGLSDYIETHGYYSGSVGLWKNRVFTSTTEWTTLKELEGWK